MEERDESQAGTLCMACGLCCTGHLFIWAKLKPSELDAAEALGLEVDRSAPSRRGFSQPCPLWKGKCTIYASPHYPRACRAYQCKLFKEVVIHESMELSTALGVVEQAKALIADLEPLLPESPYASFRERLVTYVEQPGAAAREDSYVEFRRKADALLVFYEEQFGVTGMVE